METPPDEQQQSLASPPLAAPGPENNHDRDEEARVNAAVASATAAADAARSALSKACEDVKAAKLETARLAREKAEKLKAEAEKATAEAEKMTAEAEAALAAAAEAEEEAGIDFELSTGGR